MMKTTHWLFTSSLLLGLSHVAYANHHMEDASANHCDHPDRNKDGVISREEFMMKHQARAEKMFKRLDTNQDGKIDANERKAAHQAMEHDHSMPEKTAPNPSNK